MSSSVVAVVWEGKPDRPTLLFVTVERPAARVRLSPGCRVRGARFVPSGRNRRHRVLVFRQLEDEWSEPTEVEISYCNL